MRNSQSNGGKKQKEFTESIPRGISGEIHKRIPRQISGGIPREIKVEIPEENSEMHENIPDGIAGEIPEGFTQLNFPGRNPRENPRRYPE